MVAAAEPTFVERDRDVRDREDKGECWRSRDTVHAESQSARGAFPVRISGECECLGVGEGIVSACQRARFNEISIFICLYRVLIVQWGDHRRWMVNNLP